MIELDLEVLWLTDEQTKLEKAVVEIDFKDCDTKTHTFYCIAALRPHEEKGYCEVLCNNDLFTIKESYESVRQKIKNQMNFKWN